MRNLIDQLIIGNRASFDEFQASLSKKKDKQPTKKTIKETVPFSNTTYDFSKINGELYWEEKELEYYFEITAPNAEELERLKTAFSGWVMNVMEEKIFEPYIPDYHYIGTYKDMSYTDEEDMEKTTAKVIFSAYPYKISNIPREYKFTVGTGVGKAVNIFNNSSHRITPTIITDGAITMRLDDVSYSVPVGETTDDNFKLSDGLNVVTIQNTGDTECSVTVRFYEEVF